MEDFKSKIYQPLPNGFIRLLKLKPGNNDIHFTLDTVRLADHPEYEAISYCWGEATDTRVVYCEGIPLNVTVSLYTALRHLRLPDKTRILWADAVCINQHDIAEKNTQVQLMSQIYSQPTKVLIWLGEDTTGLDGLLECLEKADEILPPAVFDYRGLDEGLRRVFHVNSVNRITKKPNFSDHNWTPEQPSLPPLV